MSEPAISPIANAASARKRKPLRVLTGEQAERHDRQQMAWNEELHQPAEEGGHA